MTTYQTTEKQVQTTETKIMERWTSLVQQTNPPITTILTTTNYQILTDKTTRLKLIFETTSIATSETKTNITSETSIFDLYTTTPSTTFFDTLAITISQNEIKTSKYDIISNADQMNKIPNISLNFTILFYVTFICLLISIGAFWLLKQKIIDFVIFVIKNFIIYLFFNKFNA